MLDPFAFRDLGQDLLLFVLKLSRDDDRNRLTDDLICAVAEQADGAFIPRNDAAVERLANDGVVRRLHDRSQQGPTLFGALLGLVQHSFSALLVGDIAHEATRIDECAVIPLHIRRNQDIASRAVLTADARGLLGQRSTLTQTLEDRRRLFGISVKLGDVMADVFRGRVAQKIELELVRPYDATVGPN